MCNSILIGQPGSEKTMLAKRIPTIHLPFTRKEALETTKVHLVVGKIDKKTSHAGARLYRVPFATNSREDATD